MKALITEAEREALSEELQQQYEQIEDGRYLLSVDPVDGYGLEDVNGLKSSLSKERDAAKKAAIALKAFEGLDASAARAALDKVSQMDSWTPQDKVAEQIERREKQLVEKYQRELEARDGSLSHMRKQLEANLIEAAAVAALNKHRGNIELLLPHVKSSTRVEEDSAGNFVARVVDRDGHARISMKSGSQDPMSIEELVEGMKSSDTFAPAFAGSGATGSGAVGNRTGGAASGRIILSYEDSRDPGKYRAAKQKAEQSGAELEIQSTPS
jgi:acetolactate synthase small subunit